MAVLNLRDVPDELARELRVEAAQADMGVREYCVAVLSSRKKIADISVGGVATEGVGDPCLPRGGKAQDGHFETKLVDAMLENIRESGRRRELSDGVPCGHAGCLSHLSHPCEGCGRIGGRRPIYNMEDNAAAGRGKVRHYVCPKGHGTFTGFEDKCPLCESEKYKSKSEEEFDGIKGSGEAGQDKRTAGGDSQPVPQGDHGAQEPAVGVGKPGVNMQVLRDICAGDIPVGVKDFMSLVDAVDSERHEVDLCGFKSYNETDGEWYVCAKETHGIKVKHGEWIKV